MVAKAPVVQINDVLLENESVIIDTSDAKYIFLFLQWIHANQVPYHIH